MRMSKVPLISVVDDDDSMRESLSGLIRSVGFKIMTFASAEEFLSWPRRADTDCLILDVRMPGMNGLELQRRLVCDRAPIPGIFITAHGDEETRAQALTVGAVDYLLKQFREEALLKAIDAAITSDSRLSNLHKE
jgi:FixJ family two-component response regulator